VIGDALTINSVKTVVLRIPLAQPVGDSQNMVDSWWLTVAMVETARGITGWGYNSGISPALKAVKTLIDVAIAPELIGCDAFRVRELWNRSYHYSHFTGESGVSFQGVAAVEIAMWDAIAKCLCQPLWRLLGGSGPPKFPAYNTDVGWLSLSSDQLVEGAKRAVDLGFAGVKVKVGGPTPSYDYARLRAVRKAIGNQARLMVDANCRWDLNTALAWARGASEFDLFWIEEPLYPFDIRGHAQLVEQLITPVMVGESITSLHILARSATTVFRDFIAASAVNILQPDALKLGGISTWCEAAALARAYELPVVPAVWDMMQIHIHLCTTIQHVLMLEYIPWLLNIFKMPVRFQDGFLQITEEPGAGTEIRMDAIEKYRVQ
jgi:L-alanine-DL-glutamate epimerase-like enolase superfamily enzyme